MTWRSPISGYSASGSSPLPSKTRAVLVAVIGAPMAAIVIVLDMTGS